jgi:hypothetical protein
VPRLKNSKVPLLVVPFRTWSGDCWARVSEVRFLEVLEVIL